MAKVPTKSPAGETEPVVQTETTASFYQHAWFPFLALAGAVFVVYFSSLSNDFVFFDDDKAILYNTALKNPSLSKFFTGQNLGMYAPLTWIAYWVGSLISGQDPFGYHLLGMVIHAVNACLVFAVLRQLTQQNWLAFFAALLFAVHPVQVEAVSWAAALSTVLFSSFYLGSYWMYIRYAQGVSRGENGISLLALSVILFTAACLSKSAAVTLPLLLVATDFLFFKEKASKMLVNKAVYLIIALIFGYMTIMTREAEGHDIEASSMVYSMGDRFFMVCQTMLFYPFKLLAPFGFTVAYPFEKTNGSWPVVYYAAPLILLGIAFLSWKMARNNKQVLFGLALYLLPLLIMLPYRTVGSFELRSDRYTYISSVGIFWLLGLLIQKMGHPLHNVLLIVLAAGLAFLTWQQTMVWKDGVKLFKNCVTHTPESSLCQCNLAYNQLIRSDFQNAADHYTQALLTDPSTIEAYNGRGQAYLNLKKIPEALEDFTKAIQSGLSSPKLYLNKGNCLVTLGRFAEAIPDLTESIRQEPKSPEAFYLRGFSYEKTGDIEHALSDYAESIRLNPKGIEAFVNRGMLHYKNKEYQAAVDDYTAAIGINGSLAMAYNNRANAWLALGQTDKALADVNKALEINPGYNFAQQTLARIKGSGQ